MFILPPLGYDYDALGNYISKNIMELHHSKHHQAYIDKLNTALEALPDFKDKTIEQVLTSLSTIEDEKLRRTVQNHGGGHYNHSEFWHWMTPHSQGQPTGELAAKITAKYGSFQNFIDSFNAIALGIFGSGWVWLQDDLSIVATPLQDSPLTYGKPAPILGLDVWEHAYYLDYTYNRADYVKAWWHVVNWDYVQKRYMSQREAEITF